MHGQQQGTRFTVATFCMRIQLWIQCKSVAYYIYGSCPKWSIINVQGYRMRRLVAHDKAITVSIHLEGRHRIQWRMLCFAWTTNVVVHWWDIAVRGHCRFNQDSCPAPLPRTVIGTLVYMKINKNPAWGQRDKMLLIETRGEALVRVPDYRE